MVSYAEYSIPTTMPTADFDLYPQQENYQEAFTSSQSYMAVPAFDHTYSTFDSQSSIQAFSNAPRSQEFNFSLDGIPQSIKNSYHSYSDAGSPANSASHSFDIHPPHLSAASESGASIPSTSSSAMGSPSMNPQYHDSWNVMGQGLGLAPGLVSQDSFTSSFEYEAMVATDKMPGCVDPTLIQPFPSPIPFAASPYPEIRTTPSPHFPYIEQPPSPAPSMGSVRSQYRSGSRHFKNGSQSPYLHTAEFAPYPQYQGSRRPSLSSVHSKYSQASRRSGSYELDEESKEKGLCPIPECGRVFKDLKAHMLTHQTERPEKCPIVTCEYHQKGFARKYDKNRHTLTHYKGTMVCGFCPGSGSAAEKSFNRADVFKRHLTSVHGVEQTPPNSRKKSPQTAKKITFANAQEFYEHLDDCVLRVVQQIEPSEGINEKLLASVADDTGVKDTLEMHCLPTSMEYSAPSYEEDEEEEEEEVDADDANDENYGARKGGVALVGSGRKKRKNYPVSWGCATDKMKMKKRVLCVYDGPRRLWKDEMMLDQEYEVRMPLGDGNGYITDLDVTVLKKAEALHNATEEEKGPWIVDNV
ncbi:hypothetical protein M501DRAFT_919641, partial [Patellaria atrata CBS 101060]